MTTRATRPLLRRPPSPRSAFVLALGFAAAALVSATAAAQEEPATQGEIIVPPHWSPYTAPTSYPEGTRLHIIQRGDTLWDLSNQYLQNPFLWPQLWDANRYIQNPHLIYPGDPVRIPDLDVVRGEGVEPGAPGQPGGPGVGPGGEPLGPGGPGAPGQPGGPLGPRFQPATEEISIQCASYPEEELDDGFRIFGSEEGEQKVALAADDVLYLNRGMRDGIGPGEMYYIQRKVDLTFGGGSYIRRTGWLRILAVQDEDSMAQVVQACADIRLGDYLTPFEPIPVPLLPVQPHATRLTPETGQMRGRITGSFDDLGSLGAGYLVAINLGEEDGVVPGNIFTVFRYLYDDAPRKMLGELAVLTVQEDTATARIMHSKDVIVVGDLIELK